MHSHTLSNPAPALRPSRIRPLALGLVAALGLLLATAMPALAQCPLSFVAPSNYAAGSQPFSVAVGDFNADGRPDLAVANSFGGVGGNSVSILLGNANGTFLPAVNYAVAAARASSRWATSTPTARPTWPWRTSTATTSTSY